MTSIQAGVRAALRRPATVDLRLGVTAAAFGLLPLLLAPPHRPVLAVLEALWAGLLVSVRRERPVAAVLGAAPLLVGGNVWTLAVAPLLVLSAARRIAPPRRAWRVAGLSGAFVMGLTLLWGLSRRQDLPAELGGNAVSVLLLLVLPTLSGTLLGRRRPLADLLRERNAYLEQTRSLTTEAARREERARIASEMHDLLGHRLSLISVHAGALELAAARQAPPLAGQVELLRTTAGTAMEELREILGVLRHADLAEEGGAERGTEEDIAALVAQVRETGGGPVALEWAVADPAGVDARARQAIHRVVREGLTNVLKHAAGAPTRVEVRSADGAVEVAVTNGPSAEASRGGTRSGLAGLQERVGLLGGTFEAGRTTDGGFRVTARLPATTHGVTARPPATTHGVTARPPATAHAPLLPEPDRPLPPSPEPPTGSRPPISADVLTWPRAVGAGCVAVLVVLPTAGFLILLMVSTMVGK